MIIPQFKEVYTKEIDGDTVKTVCQLIITDSPLPIEIGSILTFGISKTSAKSKYNKNLGMKLAYAMAMRFLMLKLNNGEKFVEDNIK